MQEKPICLEPQINYSSKQCILQKTNSIPPLVPSPLPFNLIAPITPPPIAASLPPPSSPIPTPSPLIHNNEVKSTLNYVKVNKIR